jgi:ribosomal protein S18 acetylase RimI-like enzyme
MQRGKLLAGYVGFLVGIRKSMTQSKQQRRIMEEREALLKDVTRGQVLKMKDREQDDPIERLEAMTDADLQRWMDILMLKGTKRIYTLSLAVSPRYHSRGVSSALVRCGTARTDKEWSFCWVHASEAGYPLFEEGN